MLTGLSDGYYPLGCGGAVVRTQLLLECPLELAAQRELLDDVGASDQFAADEDLWDRRPARDRGKLLADPRVGQNVDGGHGGAGLAQRFERARRVPAHDELRRALHE